MPVTDVSQHQGARGPALEVRDLDVVAQAHAVTCPGQSVPQLDVLDRGTAVRRIEAAELEEDLAADGPATGPERGGLTPRGLVDVVVEEVLVLRDKVWRCRPRVVGPEESAECRLVLEGGGDLGDGVGRHQHIGVQEEDDLASCHLRPEIARHSRSAPRAGCAEDPCSSSNGLVRRAIAGAVVDDDELPGWAWW